MTHEMLAECVTDALTTFWSLLGIWIHTSRDTNVLCYTHFDPYRLMATMGLRALYLAYLNVLLLFYLDSLLYAFDITGLHLSRNFFFFGPGWFFLFFCRRAESIIVSIRPAYDISVRPFVPLKILERDCWQQRKRRNKFKNKYNAGADPGEVKWVNFRPLFSEPPSFFFFFFLSLKYWNNIWFLWFLWLRWREFTPHFKILDPRL